MATFPVKWFSSDMGGAPTLGDTAAGDFNALLKACLVTGFNVRPITDMTYDAGTGEVTITAGTDHGFVKHQVIAVSGADQAEYNGEHRVTAIGSDWLTFAPNSVPSATMATGGTLEVKAAPHGGWEVVDEDAANYILVIRPIGVEATQHTYLIKNNGSSGPGGNENGNFAEVYVVESYTDTSTYDYAVMHYWPASHRYSDKSEWNLIAEEYLIYFAINHAADDFTSVVGVGLITSVRPGDGHHVWAMGVNTGNGVYWSSGYRDNYSNFSAFDYATQQNLARSITQLPGSVNCWFSGIGDAFGEEFEYPNGADNGFYLSNSPILLIEDTTSLSRSLRGFMPGLLQPLHTSSVYHRTIVDNLPGLEGVPVFMIMAMSRSTSSSTEDYERLVAFRLDNWR